MSYIFTCVDCGIEYRANDVFHPSAYDGLCPPCYDLREELLAEQVAQYERMVADAEYRAFVESQLEEEIREIERES